MKQGLVKSSSPKCSTFILQQGVMERAPWNSVHIKLENQKLKYKYNYQKSQRLPYFVIICCYYRIISRNLLKLKWK